MLKWTDTLNIAIELFEKYPEKDPQWINFVELRSLVTALDDFDDDHDRCNERILESIQQNWIEAVSYTHLTLPTIYSV